MNELNSPEPNPPAPTSPPLAWHWPVLLLISVGVIVVFRFQGSESRTVAPDSASQMGDSTLSSRENPYDAWGRAPAVTASTRIRHEPTSEVRPASTGGSGPIQSDTSARAVPEPTEAPRERAHIVVEGDTLGQISLDMYGSVRHVGLLLRANDLPNPDALTIGQVLKVPELPTAPVSASTNPARWQEYTVKKDDSPWKIAKKFYGDGRLYVRLIEDNPEVFSQGETMLAEGSVLKIRKNPDN